MKDDMFNTALGLAKKGFHVFPLLVNSKLPMIPDFPNAASRDPEQIKRWWVDPVMDLAQPFNIGISTSRFGDDESLIVIDVDNKDGKKGDDVILSLEMEGKEFPETYVQKTPTGGRHIVYRTKEQISQGVNVFGPGVDTRGRGGYIVAAGSKVDAGVYTANQTNTSMVPDWVPNACGRAPIKKEKTKRLRLVDEDRAANLAINYLENEAPISIEGDGGDQTAFKVAARVKDFGVSKETALELLLSHWNDRCSPPWSTEELSSKIEHAFRYGQEEPGARNPETQFEKIKDSMEKEDEPKGPIDQLNSEYAFVLAGGGHHILWETRDASGNFKLEHLSEHTFHKVHASETINFGNKTRPLTEAWITSPKRRSYDGICFNPGKEAPPRFYNLWRGFAVDLPKPGEKFSNLAKNSIDMFREHALKNVCGGDEFLFGWLMGYFGHLIQRPWEKPLVAPVFRGSKGVGKNALVERVGHLLGNHFLITANRRFLIGNFNSHLENCLFMALDEAFWSGDKQAEGTLKDLITGKTHNIEHKGKESYTVQNCTRVCIIGNEDWLTPASHDERRFAVFDVGVGRKQDRRFFHNMRTGMEEGGYKLLLEYLMTVDISKFDINDAPKTDALMDQKIHSLGPFQQWWLGCLTEGKIAYGDFEQEEWQTEISKERFRNAFKRYIKDRNIRSRVPDDSSIGKLFRQCVPQLDATKKMKDDWKYINSYRIPTLEVCRKEWGLFIGHDVKWE